MDSNVFSTRYSSVSVDASLEQLGDLGVAARGENR